MTDEEDSGQEETDEYAEGEYFHRPVTMDTVMAVGLGVGRIHEDARQTGGDEEGGGVR